MKEYPKMKRCRYCLSTQNLTVDHKIPKIQGGTDNIKNLQCLCMRCNGTKSGMSDKQVKYLFKWFKDISQSRIAARAKPFGSRTHAKTSKSA